MVEGSFQLLRGEEVGFAWSQSVTSRQACPLGDSGLQRDFVSVAPTPLSLQKWSGASWGGDGVAGYMLQIGTSNSSNSSLVFEDLR